MPSKNSRKKYLAGGYYHIYNRGVEKRNIFEDNKDYAVLLSYLKSYLLPKDIEALHTQLSDPNTTWAKKDKIIKILHLNNFAEEISLLAYCLMPNHFHLLVKQENPEGIDKFMNSLCTRYVMYFNRKYKRVGPLYQDVYKAVLVETDEQLLHLSAYIHQNPRELSKVPQGHALLNLQTLLRQPSSLPEYLDTRKTKWVKTNEILAYFSKTNENLSYKKFVLGYTHPSPKIISIVIE